ncbi:centrosome-associated protein ALMS1 isoform X1 [Tenrec ecaudatus]|uniref:centrosome-associated protein ALMS1 isoform X1 n=1 Tax=Tenrec ecaudatus TaxID=94439 RepID=UPI003F59B2B2
MEPEDLPWPSELEEEEEEEEEKEEEKEEKKKEEEPEDEVVVVEEVEGEERDLDGDFHDGSPRPESTDEGEDDDEEAKAWLQAPPSRVSPLWPQARGAEEACAEVVPLTCHVWQQGHQDNSRAQVSHPNLVSVETTQWGCADDQKTETWHCLPQETDNSQILGTSKTKFNVKEEGAKVTDSPSLEEGILTQSENRVKDRRKTFLCSPLLVIQDNFASPDLPLLTCPSQDREFGSNSLFQQSEPEFVPLRGVPDSSGDTEWFSRPSEVNEALLQATSEVASDRVSSCFSLSQYPLTGESQHSFLLPEEELHAEAISSDVAGERKTLKDSDSYDAPCSYMSLKTQDVAQQSGTKAAGRDLISSPSLSDLSDESTTLRGSGSCGACSYMQCWEEDASQPAEACLHRKDHDSFSDLSDTVDENETAKGNAMSGGPHSSRGWWTQGASPQPKPSPVSTEPASFPRDVTFHFNNQTPSSLLHLWERSGEVPLRSDNHYFESAYSKIPTKQEVKQKTGSLESDERSVGLGEGRVVSEGQTPAAVHVRLLEIQQAGRLIHPGDVFRVSEAYILSKSHGASKMEVPGGPLQTVAPNLAEAREQLCFQKDSNQKETSASGGKGLAAAESVAFEAVIASIESSKSGSAVDETHTDNTKSMTNDSPERAAEISAFSLTSYNDEKSLLGQLSRPLYQSTPGVFEPTAPKPLLPKEADDRPLYWHPDLKPQPNTFQELLTAEPTPSPLSETSHRQSAGPDRTQPLLIQGDISNEPFLPLGKIKSVSAFDLAEKIDSSEIHPVKVSSSETLLLQGLKPLSPEEVAASPLEHPQGKATSDIMTLDDDTDYRILEERAIVGKEKATELLREVDHSNLSADRSFSSTLSSIGSHETPRESEYHSPDLRMLRVSPESASKTLRLSAGSDSEGGIDELTQANVKTDLTIISGDSDISSNSSFHTELLLQLSVRSPQPLKTVGEHIDSLNQQTLPGSLVSEPALANQKTRIPTAHRETPSIPYQQELPDNHLTEETLQVLVAARAASQNADITRITSSSYSHRETLSTIYTQALPDNGLSEEALRHLAAPGPASQKTGVQPVPSASYSQREKPDTQFHQDLSDSHFPEETLKRSILGPADQKMVIPAGLSHHYSQREKPGTHYQQVLADSHLTEEVLKSLPEPYDLDTGVPAMPSSTYYSPRERPSIFYQQSTVPDSHLTRETLKGSAVAEQPNKNTGLPIVPASYYSQREEPSISSQQGLPDRHLIEQALKGLVGPGRPDQKPGIPTPQPGSHSQPGAGYQPVLLDHYQTEQILSSLVPGIAAAQELEIPTVSSGPYTHTEKPGGFYPQILSGSHLIEETGKGLAVSGQPDQNSGVPTLPSSSHSQRESLPNHYTDQALGSSSVPDVPAEQKTGIPTESANSYLLRERPSILYQKSLPDNSQTEQLLRILAASDVPVDRKAEIAALPTSSYPQRERPGFFYQQTLPDSHPAEQALRSSPLPAILSDQNKAGVPTVSANSYPQREGTSVFYPQTLPGHYQSEHVLKGTTIPEHPGQMSGVQTVPSSSLSYKEKPRIFFQQVLPDSHPTEQALQSLPVPDVPADQNKAGVPTVSTSSYPQRERPGVFYQQTLTDHHPAEQAFQRSPLSHVPADQNKAGVPTVSASSYPQREGPDVFYSQTLSDRHPAEQAFQRSPLSHVPADQNKAGAPTVSASSYPQREGPDVFYSQTLSDRHPAEQAFQRSPLSHVPADQNKAGAPTVSASSYPQRGGPDVFYSQTLSDRHPAEQALRSSPVSDMPTVSSSSYPQRERPGVFYQQLLPDSHRAAEVSRSSPVPDIPADQKNVGIPTVSASSYPQRERSGIFSQQLVPESHLTEEGLKDLDVPGQPHQRSGVPTAPSNIQSQREKPNIFYQQAFSDRYQAEEILRILSIPDVLAQQNKTRIPTVATSSYPQRERPGVSYQQLLPDSHPAEQALRSSPLLDISTNQKIVGIPTVATSSYPQRERPGVSHQQTLSDSHPAEQALRSSPLPDISTIQKNVGIPTVATSSYPQRERPGVSHQQTLSDSHPAEQALRSSPLPGVPADQKPGVLTVTTSSYPQRERPGVFHQQLLPESHLTEEALKGSGIPGQPDQKSEAPIAPSSSHSQREKPNTFYHPVLQDSYQTEQTLNSPIPGIPTEQKPGIPTVSAYSYPQSETPAVFYQQELSSSHLTEEGPESSPIPGLADQRTGILTPSSSYSQREEPGIFYQQELSSSHLIEEGPESSPVPGPADQKTGLSTEFSGSHSHTEKPKTPHQQEFPDHLFTEEPLKVLTVLGPTDQKTGIPRGPSDPYSDTEKASALYKQVLLESHLTEETLKDLLVPGSADQKSRIPVHTSSYLLQEKPALFYQQELPDSEPSEETLTASVVPGPGEPNHKVLSSFYPRKDTPEPFSQQLPPKDHVSEAPLKPAGVPEPTDQKAGVAPLISSSYSPREKPSTFYQQNFPESPLTEQAQKVSTVSGPADEKTGSQRAPVNSYSHTVKFKILPVARSDDQTTKPSTAPTSSSAQREKHKISTVIGSDAQKAPRLTVLSSSYSQSKKPSTLSQQKLSGGSQNEGHLKVSTVPEPTDGGPGMPGPLASSYTQTEKSTHFYPPELSGRYLSADPVKVSALSRQADQKSEPPTVASGSVSHREKPNIFSPQDVPERLVTEDALKVSSALGQVEQITVLPAISSSTYLQSEKHKLGPDCAQWLTDRFESPDSSVRPKTIPIHSQAEGRVTIHKPEAPSFGDLCPEEPRGSDKTLKEIQSLLMEAENIVLKRCNAPAPLIPFRDVSDTSCIQPKKVVCFKEPSPADVCSGDLPQNRPFSPVSKKKPSIRYTQKNISTQTNVKCQQGHENWEFVRSTPVRSTVHGAEANARPATEETLKRYETARCVRRSEPEGCSGAIGNTVFIPVMTVLKSDSSSDTSDGHGSCSWDSNLPESLESMSDVLLNFFPDRSPNVSMADSREEEGGSESDEGGSSSVDSLAAHVRNLLQCESSLNHAKQILRNAEEEESRVRARAWNLKLNLAHHCGYSMSELNEDDRRKVEEIKAKLIGHGRTDLSEGFQSPRGIGCQPEAVCSHIIIESHEKGCLRTLTAQETQLDSRPCAFPSDESEEAFRAQEGPSSWRARHTTLSRSPDQNNPRFKVWNSLRLQSHSPFPGFTSDNFKVSKDLRMPFHEKMDPWLSEFVEPSCLPSEGMDIHASSHIASPESLQKVTTSITFASHRHSKCMSDSSVFKVGVTEGGTGTSVGVFNSRFTEEQNPIHNQNQRSSSPFSFNMYGHPPDRNLTILAKSRKQSHKLPVNFEHAHQEEKLFRKSHFNISPFEPRPSTLGSNFISQGRRSSALRVKERNFAVTPDIPSLIFLEQRELFEQTKIPHANHHLRKHLHSPPQYQDYVPSNLPSQFPPEQQEPFEQNQALHEDSQMREHSIPLPPGQDCIALDLPSDIFLEQRKLLEQSSDPCVDHHLSSFPQDQECVMEKDNQHKPTSHIPELVNADPEFNNKVSHAVSDHCAPPLNRKAVSCVRITLSPKASSKLENGTSDKRVHKVDPVYTPRVDREFTSEQQTRSAITTEPSSTSKSSLDFHIVHFPITDSNMTTQDLKVIPSQGSQVEAARQTQANISNTDGSSTTERTPASANRAPEQLKTSAEKLLSDAVTQITTESPEKTLFSSEIFIKAEDSASKIPKPKPVGQPIRFASSSSIQHISTSRCTLAQPSLLPYKPSGCSKMYYVPQLEKLPQFPEARSDTTLESSHSGSNDAIAPEFPAQVLGTRDDDLSDIVSIKHKEGIYSKRAVGSKPCLKDTAVQVCITVDENLREKVCTQRTVTKLALPEETASLPKYSTESRCHSGLENTTHSVFRSAQFYFHHPVHLPSDQDFCHESLERGVFMRQDSCLSPPYQSVDKTKMDFTRIESLRINVNLGNKEGANAPKCQARDPLKCNRQSTDLKRDHKVTPEPAAQDTPTLNELWTQYQERQKHQKAPAFCDSKELSLVERLDRLARILQNPIAHSLQASDTGRDERREERAMKGWYSRPQQQNSKLLKKKRCKGVDRCHRNVDAPGKGSVLYTPQAERPNQIKFEHVKFNKYILRKQPGCNCRSNTSSESRPSEESELLTDTATNVFSTTTSPVESEYLTQTDKEVAVHERSSSISTIDTARLIQAFGHERVCVSPRRIKLYSSITNQQKRCLEKRCKPSPKAVPLGHFHVAAEHTRRRNIQVEEQMVSSDSVSSSASSFWNSSPILCNKQHVQMLNKGIQAGNLEIVNGARRHTRDVGLNVPTPSSSEAHLEEDSDGSSSLSEIKIEEKRIHAGHPPDRKSRRSVTSLCEGISWFVPAENLKCGSKKENLPRFYGPAVSWFEAVTNTKPWREPLREKNWQGQRVDSQMDCGGRLADPCNSEGMHPLRPFVRASLQEALHFHRPDFISRSGERIKRLKLIVQERKLQNVLQSEREALFNTGPDCPGSQRGARPRARQGFLAAHKSRAIGKKEMIQRSKRMYEQLPEVQKRKEEEKRQSEYKCYRLRAQLYKKKVTNRLLGRKVPWD